MIYNLGRVVPLFKGDYDAATTYTFLDVVFYDNSSFVALGNTTGNLPTDTDYWMPVALKGTTQNPTEQQMAQIISTVETYITTNTIVDNLTSTDTDKSLSAKQGKVLNDTKQDSNVDVYEYTDITSSSSQSGYIVENGIISTSGWNIKFYPVEQGSTYLIKGRYGSGQGSYLYAYYNGDTHVHSYAKATASTVSTIQEMEITVPTSGTITHIAIEWNTSVSAQTFCKLKSVVETYTIPEKITEIEGDIADVQADLEELQDDFDNSIYTENEYTETWITNNKTYSYTVGSAPTMGTTSSYQCIWVQNLKVGDIITVRARSGTSATTGAKTKNGLVVSKLTDNPTGTDNNVAVRTYVVDDTFDGISFNNYNGYVHDAYRFCKRQTKDNTIELINGEIEDIQEAIDTIIEQGVSKEYNILCFGNSFTQDTISYVPFLLREAEPNARFNVYFTYMGGMPISQLRAFVGGDGTESIALNASGNPETKYENHGGWDRIYSYSNGSWVEPSSSSTNYHKPYTLYKLPYDANAWTNQSEPTIDTVLNIIGEGKKWDLITIQQGGSINYKSWDYYFKPYVYEIYTILKNKLNYNFRIGYLMTHGAYANTASDLLSHYNGVVTNTTKIMENTPTEILLPYATALQNARTTYLTRFSSNVMDGAKVKNGYITEIIHKGSGNINLTCDGTFDAVVLNNDNSVVGSPTCTKNGTTQTWTSSRAYNLYVGEEPKITTSSDYKAIYLTGLVSGDVIESNNNTGDNGVCLLTDSAHVNDGIGCLTCAYANTMAILQMIGSSKSIVGSQIMPNSSWISTHNIPAASAVYGLSKYNVWLAQQCAVMAMKNPLQLTDMVAKGMCGDTEVEFPSNIISSNPILSANNGSSWSTKISAPNGSTIQSLNVYMLGSDNITQEITSTVYDGTTSTVYIPEVSGKITIKAQTLEH